jgi:hypothetical protein
MTTNASQVGPALEVELVGLALEPVHEGHAFRP